MSAIEVNYDPQHMECDIELYDPRTGKRGEIVDDLGERDGEPYSISADCPVEEPYERYWLYVRGNEIGGYETVEEAVAAFAEIVLKKHTKGIA